MAFVKESDAVARAAKWVHSKDVVAMHRATQENIENNFKTDFNTHIQILITKFGQIVSDCMQTPKMNSGYCSEALNYLCNSILEDSKLGSTCYSLGLNASGNQAKHELGGYSDTNIPKVVSVYNEMVQKAINKTGLSPLEELFLTTAKDSNARPSRTSEQPKQAEQNVATVNLPDNEKLTFTYVRAEGRVTKGLLRKQVVRFAIDFDESRYNEFNGKAIAFVKHDGEWVRVAALQIGRNSLEVDAVDAPQQTVTLRIEVTQKFRMFQSKNYVVTVSGKYD